MIANQRKIIWKVVVGGAGAVGKTTILHRFIYNYFPTSTSMTIGVQFHVQELTRNGCSIKLALWDFGGQDQFRFMLPKYCNGASGAFVLFDMSDLETMDDAENWMKMFNKHLDPDSPVLLVGTKRDLLEDQDLVDIVNKAGEEFAKKHGCIGYIPTSAKFGVNVDEAIYAVVDRLLSSMPEE